MIRSNSFFVRTAGIALLTVSAGTCVPAAAEWSHHRLDAGSQVIHGSPWQPALSRDGRYCVYLMSESYGESSLYSYDTELDQTVPLSAADPEALDVISFLISPDGSTVLFRAQALSSSTTRVFSVPTAGGARTELLTELSNRRYTFEITPDSSFAIIHVLLGTDYNTYQLFSVPLSGGPVVDLDGTGLPITSVPTYRVAPDSSRIVYTMHDATWNDLEIHSVKLDGTGRVRLGDPGSYPTSTNLEFTISDDSTEVAFENDDSLAVSAIDGSTSETVIADTADLLQLDFRNNNQEVVYLQSVTERLFPGDYQTHWEFRVARRSDNSSALLGYPSPVDSPLPRGSGKSSSYEMADDKSALFFIHNGNLYRLPFLEPSAPDDLTAEYSARDFLVAGDGGTCFFRDDDTGRLYAFFKGSGYPTAVTDAPVIDDGYALIDPMGAVAFVTTTGKSGVVRWDADSHETIDVYTEPASMLSLVAPTNGNVIAGLVTTGVPAAALAVIDTATPAILTRVEPTVVTESVDAFRVGATWKQLAYRTDDNLILARGDGSLQWQVSGYASSFEIAPNEQYIAFAQTYPLPPLLGLWGHLLSTSRFVPGSKAVALHTAQPYAPVAWFPDITIGADSLSVVSETVTYPVDAFGVPTSARFSSEAGAGEVLTGGTVPRGGDVVSSKLSPDGSARAILARYDGPYAELYVARPPDGVPFKVSGTLRTGYEVQGDYEISPDGLAVMYRANQDTGGVALWISRAPAETVSWILR